MQGNPREHEEEPQQDRPLASGQRDADKPPDPHPEEQRAPDPRPEASEQAATADETKAQEPRREEGLPPETIGRWSSAPEEPPAGGEEQLPLDVTLPDEDDWNTRPFSRSERFSAVDTEREFAAETIQPGINLPAVLGLILALFGILAGFWGIFFAALGLSFSVTGIWAAVQRDAGRLAVAMLGTGIALIFLVGHFIRMF